PPTAIPPTLTPIPATIVPATVPASVNLVVVEPFLNPPVPICRQELVVGMTIRNDGATATTTGLSRIQVVRVSTGEVFRTSGDALVAVTLNPGQTHRVEFRFTIDVFTNERHRVEFIADVNSQVAESNENDNRIGVEYPFGAC
ncbi:MAG: CARDB domain-containing protein, partial [bacterium]|nr:CARDB domain-containing protein [bacterium]